MSFQSSVPVNVQLVPTNNARAQLHSLGPIPTDKINDSRTTVLELKE